MSLPWAAPTLASRLAAETGDTVASMVAVLVRCACGRLAGADMLVQVDTLPPRLRRHFREDYACDGCRETAARHGHVAHYELLAGLGAPAAVQRTARVKHDTGGRRGA